MTVRARERHRCPLEDTVFSAEKTAAYRREGDWLDLTLVDWLRKWAAERPEAVAVSDPTRKLTFSELDAESGRVAGGLSVLGLQPGDALAELAADSAHLQQSQGGRRSRLERAHQGICRGRERQRESH